MAKNKTIETEASVAAYVDAIPDEKRREEFRTLVDIFAKSSGFEPRMWGPAIVGFGTYHYKYESGHEGDAPRVGLSSRVNAITLYLAYDFKEREELLAKFGKHKTSKACIYVKKLADIDTAVLEKMVKNSMDQMQQDYPL
ncbi:DUF1801 domain-containing protein [Dyadobacter bucti]|jgi:hypothetical protein|uniref:DUF1801 domain-containing protein n=1 Tax=Dyadobacter bucti TaxID=2572203 RepID=UPI0011082AF6|nr:DUF1801 domain-containing protein [Dyadobacter bucti]